MFKKVKKYFLEKMVLNNFGKKKVLFGNKSLTVERNFRLGKIKIIIIKDLTHKNFLSIFFLLMVEELEVL